MNLLTKQKGANIQNIETETTYEDIKVLIFKAPWCQPCKAYEQVVKQAKELYKDKPYITFETFDIEDKDSYKEILKYKIKGVPTTIVMLGDTEVKRVTGALTLDNLRLMLSLY